MPYSKKKPSKLLMASNMVSCPECKTLCIPVSCDGDRIVVRHAVEGRGVKDCENRDKLWTYAQPSIAVTEI